ncbi:MAG: hypothetical protein A2V88_07690 [Elusimicrobia bacterium RBG_16_66_12]|nr:MAG: hypothetical protein A2V88_07690 [Elusimicrobia bacterium RBG_16_66_12]
MAVGLLSLAIALSPRIPLPIVIPGRRFDLRVEDVLLLLLCTLWLVHLVARPRLTSAGLAGPLVLYLALSAVSTVASMLSRELPVSRGALYFLKDAEYLVLGLIVMHAVRTVGDLGFVTRITLLGGVLNVLWVLFQLAGGTRGPVIVLGTPVGVYDPPRLLEAYGPGLMGEVSPLSTGAYFLLVFFLALGFVQSSRSLKVAFTYGALAFAYCAGLVLSQSRVAIAGLLVLLGLSLSSLLRRPRVMRYLIITLLIPMMLTLAALWGSPELENLRFLKWEAYGRSMAYRWDVIWTPLAAHIPNSVLIGFGKGSLGVLPDMESGEAHNHYLRVILESGVLGLAAFLWILQRVIVLGSQVYRRSHLAVGRILGFTTFVSAIAFAVAGLVQDIFAPVLPNALWWMIVGLAGAAYRMERKWLETADDADQHPVEA